MAAISKVEIVMTSKRFPILLSTFAVISNFLNPSITSKTTIDLLIIQVILHCIEFHENGIEQYGL